MGDSLRATRFTALTLLLALSLALLLFLVSALTGSVTLVRVAFVVLSVPAAMGAGLLLRLGYLVPATDR